MTAFNWTTMMAFPRPAPSRFVCAALVVGTIITACSVNTRKVTAEDQMLVDSSWQLETKWVVRDIFDSPESALYDRKRDTIYVSNVSGYERNGRGYLSSIHPNGRIKDAKWIDGINAPTGMAIVDDTLYVVDFDRVVEIHIPSRSIQRVYDAPDEAPGLNDIVVAPDGEIYVSASMLGGIYRLRHGALSMWVQDPELKWANGVYADHQFLLVAGYHLRRVDRLSRTIERVGDDSILEDLETIESDGVGGYFVTQIGAKPILHASSSFEITRVMDRPIYTADIDYVPALRLMIAPSGEESLHAFTASSDGS